MTQRSVAMSGKDKRLQRILAGNGRNVSFEDFIFALHSAGFREDRQNASSHRILKDADGRIMNVQPSKDGDAKPYQIRQLQTMMKERDEK
ncbi:MAG TPA: type II toxin-antitoxin system HicA family toxin [Opitutales bacterium]|jgi:predicted RNA binding protein YcfA (HicA-like mRNA interferase family)|nr:type II toxin-antitoxin system HicA family toxin [Opitutales bacterium]